eukprot:765979-Rhodomonas_salina.2
MAMPGNIRCLQITALQQLENEQRRWASEALAIKDGADFQHILRILGTNVDGKQKVMYAMCSVKGVGRRFSNIVCKKADVDMDKRAGELTQKEMDDLVNVIQNPLEYKIPQWMLNRRKDFKDGKTTQVRNLPLCVGRATSHVGTSVDQACARALPSADASPCIADLLQPDRPEDA